MAKQVIMVVMGLLAALALTACGQGTATGGTGTAGMNTTAMPAMTAMPGMSMTAMPAMTAMPGMSMSAVPSMTSNGPFDAQFIDSMTEHHRGAIAMAQQALKEGQHPEIKQLAQNIITSQQQELEQMANWRKQWYQTLAPTGGMAMAMGDMQLSTDTSKPFDQRFLTAMLAHHAAAVMMAKQAQTKAEHPEIKQLAGAIITAQAGEITQMQSWTKQWYGG